MKLRWGDLEIGDTVAGADRIPYRVVLIESTVVDVEEPTEERTADGVHIIRPADDGSRIRLTVTTLGPRPRVAATQWINPKASLPYGSHLAEPGETHFPVCHDDGDAWPCLNHAAGVAADRVLYAERIRCRHCSKPVNSGQMKVEIWAMGPTGAVETWLFHGRKGPCSRAARLLQIKDSIA